MGCHFLTVTLNFPILSISCHLLQKDFILVHLVLTQIINPKYINEVLTLAYSLGTMLWHVTFNTITLKRQQMYSYHPTNYFTIKFKCNVHKAKKIN